MFNDNVMKKVLSHFPDIQIKYKDQSFLMKILGILLFFSPDFMEHYTTTIGSTIYFPSQQWIETKTNSANVTLLHELIHVTDSKKLSRPLFSFLYLFPFSFIPLSIILFLLSWKIAIPLLILCLCPIPAYFRMLLERRAYFASMYVEYQLNSKKGLSINLESQKDHFITQFTGSAYYFMWPLSNIKKEFSEALTKIQNGERPYKNSAFDVLDDILTAF